MRAPGPATRATSDEFMPLGRYVVMPVRHTVREDPTVPTRPATFIVVYSTPTDVEAFEHHYRQVHLPLAKALPGLRRYSVARRPQTVRGNDCYLVATLEWDSIAELRAGFTSPEGRATSEDMANLTRLSDVQSLICEPEDV